MVKLLSLLILLFVANSAQAQLAIGDSQMDAFRQLKGFGLNLDSVVENGKVRIYHADSIRIAGILNNVTVHLDDSQRVEKMVFLARDIDTAKFSEKYFHMLNSPRLASRKDEGGILTLQLEHPNHVVELVYDRQRGSINEVDRRK